MAQPKPAAPSHYKPKQSAFGSFDGEPFDLNPNEIFAADDRLVRGRPDLFTPLEATRERPVVEKTTAAPGEQR